MEGTMMGEAESARHGAPGRGYPGGRGRRIGGTPRRRGGRRDRGQSLIELVLVLPILLLVLFGTLEFANAWRTNQVITNSAREGARHAATKGSDETGVRQRVEDRLLAGGLDPTLATINLGICSEVGTTTACTGQPDTVEVAYPFQFRMIGPIASLICGNCGDEFGSITLLTRTVMRNE